MQTILLQILSVDPTHNAHIAQRGHLLLDYQRYRSLKFPPCISVYDHILLERICSVVSKHTKALV